MRWVRIGAFVTLALLAVAGVLVGINAALPKGDDFSHESVAGGFTLTLPGGWRQTSVPDDGSSWFNAEHPALFGNGTDGWVWVGRWSGAKSLDEVERDGLQNIDHDGALVTQRVLFAGHPAVRFDYNRSAVPALDWVPGVGSSAVEFRFLAEGQVFQVGMMGWRRLPRAAVASIEASFRTRTPRGVRRVDRPVDGFSLDLPAGWNEQRAAAREASAVFAAFAPGAPPDKWIYVFRRTAVTVDAAVATTTANITSAGGTDIARSAATVADQEVVRLDFLLPNTNPEMTTRVARDVEFFVADGDDVFVIGIGQNDYAESLVTDFAKSFELRSEAA